MTSHLQIIKTSSTGKTDVFTVYSTHGGSALARIAWWAPWRRYTLQPHSGTVWDSACLAEIQRFLDERMAVRKHGAMAAKDMLADMTAGALD